MARFEVPRGREGWFFLLLLATLVLLLAHALEYRFLTDDAFISFRYARNLSEGHGLVFNPGHERVEGYTNFLWVVILAALNLAGLAPESTAHFLTFGLTVALWALVAWFACRGDRSGHLYWLALAPPAWLAVTRSVAVWSSGGLETRLFEVLMLAGVLRLAVEVKQLLEEGSTPRPLSAGLFALGTLTRPDGLLITLFTLLVAGGVMALRRRFAVRYGSIQFAVYGLVVGSHYVFRRIYYGDWFPNTYYAKAAGERWWAMGFDYALVFLLEYAVWLWVPLLLAAVVYHRKRETLWLPLLFAAAIVPHGLYIVSIGGDHFEYRPFDLYFPLLFLLMLDGTRELARSARAAALVAAYSLLVAAGLVALPYQAHRQFPGEYLTAFPGEYRNDQGEVYLLPERDPVYRWPGLRTIAEAYKRRLMRVTSHFVGLRQEEHELFLSTVAGEGRRLGELVESGVIRRDTYVAIDSVGAMPYYSDLRTLDRLGLTDREVARTELVQRERLAHDKHATMEYARERRVDFWAAHPVHLLFRMDDPEYFRLAFTAVQEGTEEYYAEVGGGYYLLCRLPQGLESSARRFPALGFRSLQEPPVVRALLEQGRTVFARAVEQSPSAARIRATYAEILRWQGRTEESAAQYAEVIRRHPEVLEAYNNLALALARLGRLDEAIARLGQALRIEDREPVVYFNLGSALAQAGREEEAIATVRRALVFDPQFIQAHRFLCTALTRRGRGSQAAPHCAAAGAAVAP